MNNNCLIALNICFGSIKPYSIFCGIKPEQTINNIIEVSKDFDFLFIVNDNHDKNDSEFNHLPEHNIIGTSEVGRLTHFEKKFKSKYIQFLDKKTLSAVHSTHNKNIILSQRYDKIMVCGFSLSTDIIATCIDLIDEKRKVIIKPNCCDDISIEQSKKSLEYLALIGTYETKLE